MPTFVCPIRQPQSHCSVCHFSRDGKCAHAQITKERDDYAKKLASQEMTNANWKL